MQQSDSLGFILCAVSIVVGGGLNLLPTSTAKKIIIGLGIITIVSLGFWFGSYHTTDFQNTGAGNQITGNGNSENSQYSNGNSGNSIIGNNNSGNFQYNISQSPLPRTISPEQEKIFRKTLRAQIRPVLLLKANDSTYDSTNYTIILGKMFRRAGWNVGGTPDQGSVTPNTFIPFRGLTIFASDPSHLPEDAQSIVNAFKASHIDYTITPWPIPRSGDDFVVAVGSQ